LGFELALEEEESGDELFVSVLGLSDLGAAVESDDDDAAASLFLSSLFFSEAFVSAFSRARFFVP
jgi:hypothetical protein